MNRRGILVTSRQMGTRAFSIWAVIVFSALPSYALSRVSTALSTVCLDNNGQHEGGRFIMDDTKLCDGLCGENKLLTDFSLHPTPRDPEQRRTHCKDCRAAEERAKRDARPERHILTLMIQRCTNPNHPKAHCYSERGITICDEWLGPNGFESFFAHVGPRPSDKHSIERKDNNKGYEPGNVRWATQIEQMQNTRVTIMLTAFNKTLSLTQWAAETGIKRRTLEWRHNEGLLPEQVLRRQKHTFFKKRGSSCA